MRKILIFIAFASLLVACSQEGKDGNAAAGAPVVNAAPEPKPIVNPPAPVTEAVPQPEYEVPQRVNRLMSTPVGPAQAPGPSIKINATTPEAFIQSLQSIERQATKEKVDLLRGALTVLQLQTEKKISEIAAKQSTPPQFTDAQLMQIAFGEINGMTADQVIEHARKVGKDVVPVK